MPNPLRRSTPLAGCRWARHPQPAGHTPTPDRQHPRTPSTPLRRRFQPLQSHIKAALWPRRAAPTPPPDAPETAPGHLQPDPKTPDRHDGSPLTSSRHRHRKGSTAASSRARGTPPRGNPGHDPTPIKRWPSAPSTAIRYPEKKHARERPMH
ncbi:hypothetical protein Ae406Ps2_6419c [Pseudonocardia sp. Ae406_Ps2]|nr:hypothetical protein Ae406Ps2_6419c [Pseudonocardia sp. Ae406_Ps2]OLM08286.1 hypothetical protein Ae505Ps2_6237 [Pseudonocardia sp. Ae505_Ps2]